MRAKITWLFFAQQNTMYDWRYILARKYSILACQVYQFWSTKIIVGNIVAMQKDTYDWSNSWCDKNPNFVALKLEFWPSWPTIEFKHDGVFL